MGLLCQFPEQVCEQIVPLNMIYVLDKMPGVIKGKPVIIFRNGAVDQTVFFEITIQQPGNGGDIPDSSCPGRGIGPAFGFSSSDIYQIITEFVLSPQM